VFPELFAGEIRQNMDVADYMQSTLATLLDPVALAGDAKPWPVDVISFDAEGFSTFGRLAYFTMDLVNRLNDFVFSSDQLEQSGSFGVDFILFLLKILRIAGDDADLGQDFLTKNLSFQTEQERLLKFKTYRRRLEQIFNKHLMGSKLDNIFEVASNQCSVLEKIVQSIFYSENLSSPRDLTFVLGTLTQAPNLASTLRIALESRSERTSITTICLTTHFLLLNDTYSHFRALFVFGYFEVDLDQYR
jgi:hypothetical protein